MIAAELVVRITGDIGDLTRKLVEAGAEVKAFGDDAQTSNRRTSTAFRDTEKALTGLDKASRDVRYSMNGRGPGLFGAIGEVAGGVLKLGHVVNDQVGAFGQWLQEIDQGQTFLTGFGSAISALPPMIGFVTVGIAALGVALLILPALAAAAMFILQALADTVGTLAAIVYAALGPLGLLAAMLGGLGVGFFLAGQRAMKGGGDFKAFADTVDHVKHAFGNLVGALAHDFLPYFDRLAHAALIALHYFQQLAAMPLDAAFKSLATKGVSMLTRFLTDVGQVLAKPFRLAVKVAFGGLGVDNKLQPLLGHLGDYLFGHTVTIHPHTRIAGARPQGITQNIPGALAPIQNWFDRHDFTKVGIRWGNELVNGFLNSGGAKRIAQWAGAVGSDAGKRAGHTFMAALGYEILSAIPRLIIFILSEFQTLLAREATWQMKELSKLWGWIKQEFSSGWKWVSSNATGEWHTLMGRLKSDWNGLVQGVERNWKSFTSWLGGSVDTAWNAIKRAASRIWGEIVSLVEKPFQIHINWPSPPGWFNSLLSKGGSIFHSITSGISHHTAAGGIITRPTQLLAGESGAEAIIPLTGGMGRHVLGALGGGGGGVHIHINNPTFLSGGRPAARELARVLKPELERIVTAR